MEKISTYIVSQNVRLKELLVSYLADYKQFKVTLDSEDLSSLYNEVSSLEKSVLFVDMDYVDISMISRIFQDSQNTKIVAIEENPNVDFIVNAVRSGVREILEYPLIKSEVIDVIKRIEDSFKPHIEEHGKCKMISVFSNKGGIGKTSIAANLAYELAQITKEDVALIDFNQQFGDITTFMDLKPAFDSSYIFENLNSLNKDFLLSSMEQYKNSSLYVLADTPYLKPRKTLSVKQISKFFEILKDSFSYIVVDTEASFSQETVATLDYSDLILLVTIINMPALRNCQRCLELFSKLGYYDDKVQILINRYMENDEISCEDVEKLLSKDIYWKIPNNYFALMSAINNGVLLCEKSPESNVAKSYKELAMTVSDSIFNKKLINKFVSDDKKRFNDIWEM